MRAGLAKARRVLGSVLIAGVAAGVAGAVLSLALKAVQHALFGYADGSFGAAVERAPEWRRVLGPVVGAVSAGLGW